MEEFDDLETYNGNAEHDMWVDYTTHEYTSELEDLFGDSDSDDYDDYS